MRLITLKYINNRNKKANDEKKVQKENNEKITADKQDKKEHESKHSKKHSKNGKNKDCLIE